MHSDSLNNQPAGSRDEPASEPQRLNRRQEIVDAFGDDQLLFLSEPEFDEAIIGIARRIGQEDAIAYNSNKVYEILAKQLNTEDWTVIFEYFEFNILGAYVGERTPVFVDIV
jgi:hypothetical protein